MKNIRERWRDICNEYLKLFAEKHDFPMEDNDEYNWVGSDSGTIAMLGDFFIGMDAMRYDIDNNVPENVFLEWYDYDMELGELGVDGVNYESYVKGARPYDEKDLDKLRELKRNVWNAQRKLEDCIYEVKNRMNYGK